MRIIQFSYRGVNLFHASKGKLMIAFEAFHYNFREIGSGLAELTIGDLKNVVFEGFDKNP